MSLSGMGGRRTSMGTSLSDSQKNPPVIIEKLEARMPRRLPINSPLLMQSASPERIIRCSFPLISRDKATIVG